ncbi:unnamed protein product [Spirodela intermedia]|uniref:Uncharacterized protein n=2 Tax=Spirodela intermedia TaxID=51605 RepID=A0A7I8K5Q0_SPIIN|nr:unnamed protein product [Spirodela intermedia]CAA6656932.1 unnamed protein product [Spirodela intermedia]CAA7392901.1 unnamed protein product [Spirodela intermedia]
MNNRRRTDKCAAQPPSFPRVASRRLAKKAPDCSPAATTAPASG